MRDTNHLLGTINNMIVHHSILGFSVTLMAWFCTEVLFVQSHEQHCGVCPMQGLHALFPGSSPNREAKQKQHTACGRWYG